MGTARGDRCRLQTVRKNLRELIVDDCFILTTIQAIAETHYRRGPLRGAMAV